MSDTTARSAPARPVSLITVVFIFALFAAFLLVVRHFSVPVATPPQNAAPENLAKDLEWKATRESRRTTLATLREKQIDQASHYAWVDQKKGVVQLPIERAMELIAAPSGGKK